MLTFISHQFGVHAAVIYVASFVDPQDKSVISESIVATHL